MKRGFRGPIYCTPPTVDLAEVLLLDAAHLQEEDARYFNRKGHTKHKPALSLFDTGDAREALKLLRDADPAAKVGVAAFNSQLDELCPVGSKIARAEEAIRGIGPSWRATRLGLALKQADRVLTRAGRSEARRRIVVIGDFQETSWKDPGAWCFGPISVTACAAVASLRWTSMRSSATCRGAGTSGWLGRRLKTRRMRPSV